VSDDKDWKGEVAIEVYRDGAKPTVKAVGDAVGSVVKVLLSPFKMLADAGLVRIERLAERLAGKVPPERLQLPPGPIAGPAVLHYMMLGEGDDAAELREMFETLLLASMDSETAATAHPAFVSMLSQMTREEAWILKSIDRDRYYASDVFRLDERGANAGPLGTHTLLGVDVVEDPRVRMRCISNLDRLGILRISMGSSGAYDQADALSAYIDKLYAPVNTYGHAGLIEVTPLGLQFLKTCCGRTPDATVDR